MARGSNAKFEVANRIRDSFGNDFVGASGGKLYVWADDGGERVQIALAMTCPKVFLDCETSVPEVAKTGAGIDFEAVPQKKAEVTQEELDRLAAMMSKLGL